MTVRLMINLMYNQSMVTEQTKVASNTTWFTMALILQKIISFVYFTYLARVLGVVSLGQYVFALSFIAIFSIVIDFGTNHFITREVAKDRAITQKLYGNIIGFKIFSSLLAIGLVVLFINLLGYPTLIKQLVYVTAVLMVIESLVMSSYAIMRGYYNLKFESFGTVGVQVIVMVVGIFILQITQDLRILMLVLVGANLLNLIYITTVSVNRLNLNIRAFIDLAYWRNIFKVVLPFALAAGFTRIYGSFDQVLLSKLASNEALGFYAVAYKLTFALQFLPLALVAALYPAMSTYFAKDKQLLNKSFTRAVYYLLILTIPLSLGVIVLAKEFITTLYTSNYLLSVLPLQVLIGSLVFLFINFPLGSLLNAANKQARNTLNIFLAMTVNIILNFILIPKYQATGAAIASAVSTAFLFILGWQAIRGIVKLDYRYLILTCLKTLLASLIMMIIIFLIKPYLYWLLAAIVGLVIYILLQFMLGAITKRDVWQLYQSFIRK